ncbi:minor capsid protein [Gordonia phage Wojtek]|uniref:Minor capsid protein n=1 Tax=Gordonia phage Wojtek TaxID=2910758 RepID=A0AA49BPF7_9CAUD|nr:minor capsid protein [Gordonia phage Wojtek]
MSADYDKYEPYSNGFRAILNADFTDPDKFGVALGVGLNANGLLVVGAGQTGIVGVLILGKKKKAGAAVDVMTSGEITGFPGVAGTKYFADATSGALSATDGEGKTFIGFTAEADRLIVRTGSNYKTPAA